MGIFYAVIGVFWLAAGVIWAAAAVNWFKAGSRGLGWMSAALAPLHAGLGVGYILLATGVWS